MKKSTLFIGLMAILFLSSCTSLNKMVERGDYDEAIIRVANKITGKKNKKTKDIKILEKAFKKITEEDLAHAEYLKNMGRESTWDEIYNTYERIEERQELIRPFLPLVSKDGYKAKFKFANVFHLKKEAADKATAYHYNEALRYKAIAEKGDKSAARRAFDELAYLNKYTDSYKDSEYIKEEVRHMGINRVLVQLHNNTFGFMPESVEDEIMSVNVKELNTFWTKYYTKKADEIEFDFVARLDIDHIEISPEREVINRFVETKEIVDGWAYVLDDNGNVKKDSLGNDIKVDKYVTVRADVVEVHRTKAAIASGRMGLFDAYTKELIETNPFNVDAHFNSYASSFNGDRRALCDQTLGRLRRIPAPFPSDLDMTLDVAYNLKGLMKNELRRFSI